MRGRRGARSHVTHLECSGTGEHFDPHRPQGVSATGKPLLVRYDLERVRKAVGRAELMDRKPGLWRYRELLPLPEGVDPVSLGEIATPLISLPATAAPFEAPQLLVKDEGRLPTASFKARGLAVAVSMARSFGTQCIAMPTIGSGGAALAAYCASAGIEAHVFCPADVPDLTVREASAYGANVYMIDGTLEDCGGLVARVCAEFGWFNASTLREPYRIEGKKTMGLELADQLGWELPDLIFYPTGGGTGFIGMWKAFEEMQALGWIGAKRPRMVAVQTTGCCPIVRASERGDTEVVEPWPDIRTSVHGVRVAKALGDFLILRVIYESGGWGAAVEDAEVHRTRLEVAADDGVLLAPEGAACVAAWQLAIKEGRARPDERAVLFNTAIGLRADLPQRARRLDATQRLDLSDLLRAGSRANAGVIRGL